MNEPIMTSALQYKVKVVNGKIWPHCFGQKNIELIYMYYNITYQYYKNWQFTILFSAIIHHVWKIILQRRSHCWVSRSFYAIWYKGRWHDTRKCNNIVHRFAAGGAFNMCMSRNPIIYLQFAGEPSRRSFTGIGTKSDRGWGQASSTNPEGFRQSFVWYIPSNSTGSVIKKDYWHSRWFCWRPPTFWQGKKYIWCNRDLIS